MPGTFPPSAETDTDHRHAVLGSHLAAESPVSIILSRVRALSGTCFDILPDLRGRGDSDLILRNATMAQSGADLPRNGKSSTVKTQARRLSDRFLHGLKNATSVTFVSHVHPDPDSLGSMLGLAFLVEEVLGKATRLTRDGLISRAENRAMVDLLDIDLEPIETVSWHEGEPLGMVDSQPTPGRHNCNVDDLLYGVIDHHDTPGDLEGVPFVDVRRSLGATCSIVTSYLMEQALDVPPRIATGLLYGIETEL